MLTNPSPSQGTRRAVGDPHVGSWLLLGLACPGDRHPGAGSATGLGAARRLLGRAAERLVRGHPHRSRPRSTWLAEPGRRATGNALRQQLGRLRGARRRHRVRPAGGQVPAARRRGAGGARPRWTRTRPGRRPRPTQPCPDSRRGFGRTACRPRCPVCRPRRSRTRPQAWGRWSRWATSRPRCDSWSPAWASRTSRRDSPVAAPRPEVPCGSSGRCPAGCSPRCRSRA